MSFAERIYKQLCKVPRGRVTTYKDLAKAVNSTGYRAVGQAMRKNPDAPRIPCHRVVASDGSIGGFSGAKDGAPIKRKIKLLEAEGLQVDQHLKVLNFDEVRMQW